MDKAKIVISLGILNEIVNKCVGVDEEKVLVGVGFIYGHIYKVENVFECRNISPNPKTHFVADPICLYNVFKYAENKGMNIVMLVHSHPAPPTPSIEDLKGMKLWRVPWLIIDSLSGRYSLWLLVNEDLHKIDVELT